MDKKVTKFNDTEIKELEFNQYKSPILINDIDINEIEVSYKIPFGKQDFKYFIGYKDNNEIRPLRIFFLKWVYTQDILIRLNAKCMHFTIKSGIFFDKCMKIWEIIRNIIKKQFNRGLIYKKHLKAEKRFKTKESFLYFLK